jgi:hypothetical protein
MTGGRGSAPGLPAMPGPIWGICELSVSEPPTGGTNTDNWAFGHFRGSRSPFRPLCPARSSSHTVAAPLPLILGTDDRLWAGTPGAAVNHPSGVPGIGAQWWGTPRALRDRCNSEPAVTGQALLGSGSESATRPKPSAGGPGETPGPTVKVRMRGSARTVVARRVAWRSRSRLQVGARPAVSRSHRSSFASPPHFPWLAPPAFPTRAR